ncbi:hypothetical protein BJ138DRAFT_1055368 [Hygrophoropsis aurantiaca]|uniref:Uncharacterized protein n=1 Tax=Hygrophoropsis aurantiaca TaxID=72124 RepID=A0ACB8AR19_9AGAM|nr:hypothetical protein BJ138DRAFT_1055368 [Hygrophoropsis aurantiaca]
MGVQGLWDIINKAGQSRSLAILAVTDGFEKNTSGRRALRVGIDASIWYQHASFSKGGENPELRLLFFRLRSLAELPILPLFIFDGRERPQVKRGSRLGKSGSHGLTNGMKKLLDIFGMEWREAFGEAEAELAHLNRFGIIDAIMTDDVDALVFGALRIIKNSSLTLSGNKSHPALNADGKASKHHAMIYTAEEIRRHPEVGLTRGGFIMFALLAGGDYDSGIPNIGKTTAHALARCGFGDQLLDIFHRRVSQDIRPALSRWRDSINTELHTNSQGLLRNTYPALSLPSGFPNMQLLENYANPICSGRNGGQGGGPMRDNGELNLARAAAFCEDNFGEWGYRSAIIKRFRDLLWEAAVMRVLRRAALEADEKERTRRLERGLDVTIKGPLSPAVADTIGTPSSLVKKYLDMTDADRRRDAFLNGGSTVSKNDARNDRQLISKIVGERRHVSTDSMLEYRVEVCPSQLVDLARSGIKGKRPERPGPYPADDFEDLGEASSQGSKIAAKKPPPDPEASMRMWIPASMMRQVHPSLVLDYEAVEGAKQSKKSDAANGKWASRKGKKRANASDVENEPELSAHPVQPSRALPRSAWEADYAEFHDPVPTGESSTTRLEREMLEHYSKHSFAESPKLPTSRAMSLGLQKTSGFLFTIPNPDDPSLVDPEFVDEPPVENTNNSEDADPPPDRFDRLFDQVMGYDKDGVRVPKSTSSHSNKKSNRVPSKRYPTNLDSTVGASGSDSTRTTKKRKVTPSIPKPIDPQPSRIPSDKSNSRSISHSQHKAGGLNPAVLDIFSDSDEESIFRPLSASVLPQPRPFPLHREKALPAGPSRFNPGSLIDLSSSQESGLYGDGDEMIIDLT